MKSVTFKIHDSDLKNNLCNKVSFWVMIIFVTLLFVTCEKEGDKPTSNNKVVLALTTVTNSGYFTLNVSSSLSQTGGQTLTDHGFCYATSPNPEINASVKSLGKRTEQGDFSAELTNLEDNKKYYIRAFATLASGTLYSNQKEITTLKAGKPRVSSSSLSDITLTSAVCGGTIESDSGYAVTASGICWDTDNQFNENQCLGKAINTSGNSNFSLNITGLSDGTIYYVKAYANNLKGTGYGEIRMFSSATNTLPTVTTNEVTDITNNTATCGGNVTNGGGSTVSARGIIWNITDNPTLQDHINYTFDWQGLGPFINFIGGLLPGTTYYVRAYATNISGTAYGDVKSFTTSSDATLPALTSASVTNITSSSAITGGNVLDSGGATVNARGVSWSTSQNPTLNDNYTTDGSGTGTFVSNLTGLYPTTTYYVRAYATNSQGTAYGIQVSFTTTSNGFVCGDILTINHIAGDLSPVNKTVNYGTVETDLTGSNKCWITQNLGSDRQALSAIDDSEASAGWYWQFNRKQGYKHDGSSRTPNTIWESYINENNDWLPANDPCSILLGNGWRLPINTEWEIANATGGWDNYNETYASVLKLSATGYLLNNNGELNSRGSGGFYWSSSQGSSLNGRNLYFNNGVSNMGSNYKAGGFTIRCLRD